MANTQMGKPGFWNANEQVSGEQGWTPVQKLGDYSVPPGGSPDSFFGTLAAAAAGVAGVAVPGAGSRTGSFLQGASEAGMAEAGLPEVAAVLL